MGIFCAATAGFGSVGARPMADFLPEKPGGYFLNGASIDVRRILPPPPEAGSIVGRAELETILRVQAARTEKDVASAKFIEDDNLFNNASVLGEWFSKENLPVTAAFFAEIDADVSAVHAKSFYPRRRPPFEDKRVQPCVHVADTGSYPSGHAVRAWVWAALLTEIFPEYASDLAERAGVVGWARVTGGTHYPSDTLAGEVLAKALVVEFLKNPAVRAQLEKCREEAQPFLLKKAA